MKDYKKIKIAKHYVNEPTTYCIKRSKVVPKIAFSGEWLQALGFEAGNTVSMKIEIGRITILSI